ncbi:transposase family protein [Catenibacterium sp.]|uniref:transposase family protein n=1 Tax=Catenibacterium sp. TaxID=2049022 RepID=UPI002E76DD4F|nr:transposase family protein [Catenibacterium sp.]MEE0041197.1 transposase family protein [Catenibacterium sp.]
MKTNNNSLADKQAAKTDTPNALISDNDLLKFFNLEKENVQDFSITHRKDGMYVNITLNKTWVQCPVCGHMTSRVKDYTNKKITHSVMTTTNCYIIYHARRYECPHCKKTFYENNPFTFGGRLSVATVFNVLRDLKAPNATLLMSLKDMAYPLRLLLILSTNMSTSPEDSFLNAWLWMKYTPSSLMTVIMYV